MRRRSKMSRRGSRRNFKKGLRIKSKNRVRMTDRGGIRL